MNVRNVQEIEPKDAGIPGVRIRVAIGREEGAPNFVMRYFDVAPGRSTADHSHAWEHEVYVAKGRGAVVTKDGAAPIRAGDTVYVAPYEQHHFENVGQEALEFICVVPHTD
ncbi:MAG: cupin domain-containing protein [Candidatus Eisenbacteria bacterium]